MAAIAKTRATPRSLRPFTAAEYERMVEAGILCEDERVELLEGAIIQMAPIGSRHRACVNDLNALFVLGLGGRAIVSVQNAVQLSSMSMPEPDLQLLRHRPDHYRAALPGPGDVLLLVEISDTTLRYDREVKLPLYAAASIPEVWIVDPRRKRVLVHRLPDGRIYRQITTVPRDGTVAPEAFPDLHPRVGELFR